MKNSPLTIVQLGPYPPPHGGVEANLVAIHEYVRQAGARSVVINLTRFRRHQQDDVLDPETGFDVLWLLIRFRGGLFHLHIGGDVTNRLLLLGLMAATIAGGRALLTLHSGGYPSSPAGSSARPATLRGFVFRRFAGIIAVNRQMVEMFERFGVSRERIHLIAPFSVSPNPPDVEVPAKIKDFVADHEPVLVTMGALEPQYDFSLQIRGLAKLRHRYPRAGLIIMGEGEMEKELRELSAAEGCAADVLMAGDVPHPIALAVLAKASMYLRTTWYDGDAISVREALAYGTPVIASDNGMRPAGVRLIPPRDLSALCEEIERTLEAPRDDKGAVDCGSSNIQAVWELYQAHLT